MFLVIFLFVLVIQRLLELFIAKRNEKWMLAKGAIEYGKEHYKYMVLLHSSFFVAIIMETLLLHKQLNDNWVVLLIIFIIVQLGRIWVISSLGKYWNTKIIVLPNIRVITKGPFKYIKHPNYLIVTIELLVIPLIFNSYITAITFFFLNQLMLFIRIPIEERALKENTDYIKHFKS